MRTRPFGNTGLHVAEVGMGCNRLAEAQCPESHWIDLVREAVDLGVTIFDTAEAYQQGGSEDILGKALGNADGIYIASKVGGSSGAVFSSAQIVRACEASLKRLRRDCVDVYQLHSPSREEMEQCDWSAALQRLREAGKIRVRAVAVSSAADGIWLIEQGLVEALQITYNLLDTSAEERLFPLAQERGIALLGRLPLAQGILSGKFVPGQTVSDDHRAVRAGSKMEQRITHAETLKPLGDQYEGGLTRLAHHFSLSAPAISCTIPGARTSAQLRENVASSGGETLSDKWKTRIARVQKTWNKE